MAKWPVGSRVLIKNSAVPELVGSTAILVEDEGERCYLSLRQDLKQHNTSGLAYRRMGKMLLQLMPTLTPFESRVQEYIRKELRNG